MDIKMTSVFVLCALSLIYFAVVEAYLDLYGDEEGFEGSDIKIVCETDLRRVGDEDDNAVFRKILWLRGGPIAEDLEVLARRDRRFTIEKMILREKTTGKVEVNSTLTIHGAVQGDSMNYTCCKRDTPMCDSWQRQQRQLNLSILPAQTTVSALTDLYGDREGFEGSDIKIVCETDLQRVGTEDDDAVRQKILWLRGGPIAEDLEVLASRDRRFKIETMILSEKTTGTVEVNSTLTIHGAVRGDSMNYTCCRRDTRMCDSWQQRQQRQLNLTILPALTTVSEKEMTTFTSTQKSLEPDRHITSRGTGSNDSLNDGKREGDGVCHSRRNIIITAVGTFIGVIVILAVIWAIGRVREKGRRDRFGDRSGVKMEAQPYVNNGYAVHNEDDVGAEPPA